MSITIRTIDLVGILSDTVPFAASEKDAPSLSFVRLEWDGEMLHAQATDRFRIAWSQWHPDDEPEGDVEVQTDLFTRLGSGDDAWHCFIPLSDAEHAIKTFKLPSKEAVVVPLTVDYDAQRGRVKITRSRDSGHSAIDVTIDTPMVDYPDLRAFLARNDVAGHVSNVSFTARLLSDFAKVRARGPLRLEFTPGELVHVTIGDRFTGSIAAWPREKKNEG